MENEDNEGHLHVVFFFKRKIYDSELTDLKNYRDITEIVRQNKVNKFDVEINQEKKRLASKTFRCTHNN